ncbi:MAG: sigma-54-dependent Fis family transcriptional regulator [Acidobacteriaceae bacterium]|nr:sigma-54-dependent Fis family transcriptional regulator [Acidobacteriaceae bacterium]
MNNARIMVVEDEDTVRNVATAVLKKQGYETTSAGDAEQALEILQRSPVDLLITDLHLPGNSGMELLKTVRADSPHTIVVVMTAFGTVHSAVEAMKSGAYDYLTKPVHSYDLLALVSRALDHHRLIEELDVLRGCLDQKYGFENIIGFSESLMATLDVAARVASSDVTVTIHGETGTGKELLAKAIHFRSPRRDRPFVTVNCGAIPRELIESELFGHVKGSFTGAVTHKKGKAETADRGTIFLDEIGEMPLDLQVRVLRLIQEREIEKIGAAGPTKLDVRIIAATHRNLAEMVKAGSFRADLYYRLMVVPIELPPLRDRKEDIPELVRQFFKACKAKHGRSDLTLPSDLLSQFSGYSWPGNVRQLQNAIERMVLLAKSTQVTSSDLPEFLQSVQPIQDAFLGDLPETGISLDEVQKELIVRALQKFGGNQSRAARFLRVSRRTLAYRLEKYGLPDSSLKVLSG